MNKKIIRPTPPPPPDRPYESPLEIGPDGTDDDRPLELEVLECELLVLVLPLALPLLERPLEPE